MFKKILIHIRTSIKLISLVSIATFLIIGLVAFCYKPIYSVTVNGEMVGYSGNKSQLQAKINEYIENGEGENTAFVQIENLPEYKLCLLKRGIKTNDEEIYEMVKQSGVPYYKYYAILNGEEEKYYVSNFEEAEKNAIGSCFSIFEMVCVKFLIFSVCFDTIEVIDIKIIIKKVIHNINKPFILSVIPNKWINHVNVYGQITMIPKITPAASQSNVYFNANDFFFKNIRIIIK